MEQQSREVRSSRGVTVIHGHEQRSSLVFYAAAAAATGGIIYLSVFRGWRLSDLCYVTQRTFRHGVANVAAGLDALSARVADVRARLQARIAEVAAKQDEAAAAQAAMRAQLASVAGDVEAVRGQVGQVHGAVLDMDAALAEVGANQRAALHGIYILCKAVGELSQGSAIPSKTELLEFTQSAAWQRMRPQGLEGLLRADGNAPFGARAPFALGGGSAGAAGLLKSLPNSGGASSSRAAYCSEGYTPAAGGGLGGLLGAARTLRSSNATTDDPLW